jgi:hypothetical protein
MIIDFPVILNSLVSVVSLLGVVWLSAVKVTALEVKVEKIWNCLMKRAMSEAIVQGIAVHNSPVRITDETKRWMSDLIPPIKEFYVKLARREITDAELVLEIERRFGERILNEVCIPHGLYMGACLLIAIQAADGTEMTQMVAWRNKAWAVCAFNSISESIEAAGFAAKGSRRAGMVIVGEHRCLPPARGIPCQVATAGNDWTGFC